ncbi:MAG: serine/threonine protein kinase, partial [Armatimonadota bacterium]|nr:serine/threonine protein kinase [Armatimonadota bacterium]
MLEPLGQGGFGITYLALDAAKNRSVAIKEFFPTGCIRRGPEVCATGIWTEAAYGTARKRFLREAQTLRQFDHPGIVPIFHTFQENNTAYMVMEYLEGKSLRAVLDERGSLPAEVATNHALQVCDALQVLHNNGVLHLDVKPANIILDARGSAVLIDFGAARGLVLGHTASPTVVVTPGYAPLEQYDEVAERGPFTDIYSLSATLYHLLTGIAPVSATGRAAGVPLMPLGEFDSSLPAGLQRAVMEGLELDRKDRPGSIEAFTRLLTGKVPLRSSASTAKLVLPLSSSEGIEYLAQPANATPSRAPLRYHPRLWGWILALVVISLFLAAAGAAYYYAPTPSPDVIDPADANIQVKAPAPEADLAPKKTAHVSPGSPSPVPANEKMSLSLETASAADVAEVKQNMTAESEDLAGDDVSGWHRCGAASVKTTYSIDETGSPSFPYIGRVVIKVEQPMTDTFPTAAEAIRGSIAHVKPSTDTLTYSY